MGWPSEERKPSQPGRSGVFSDSIREYLGNPSESTEAPDDFDLSPEKEAYYKGLGVGLDKSVEVQNARKEQARQERAARPKAPRAPKPPTPEQVQRRTMQNVRHLSTLARRARGRR